MKFKGLFSGEGSFGRPAAIHPAGGRKMAASSVRTKTMKKTNAVCSFLVLAKYAEARADKSSAVELGAYRNVVQRQAGIERQVGFKSRLGAMTPKIFLKNLEGENGTG